VLSDTEAALVEKLTGQPADALPAALVERFITAARRHEKAQGNLHEAEDRMATAFRGVLNVVRNISEGRREQPKKPGERFGYVEQRGIAFGRTIAVHTVIYIEAERGKRELESVGRELAKRQA